MMTYHLNELAHERRAEIDRLLNEHGLVVVPRPGGFEIARPARLDRKRAGYNVISFEVEPEVRLFWWAGDTSDADRMEVVALAWLAGYSAAKQGH